MLGIMGIGLDGGGFLCFLSEPSFDRSKSGDLAYLGGMIEVERALAFNIVVFSISEGVVRAYENLCSFVRSNAPLEDTLCSHFSRFDFHQVA